MYWSEKNIEETWFVDRLRHASIVDSLVESGPRLMPSGYASNAPAFSDAVIERSREYSSTNKVNVRNDATLNCFVRVKHILLKVYKNCRKIVVKVCRMAPSK